MNPRGVAVESELEHWKRELASAPHKLELPTDLPRPSTQSRRRAFEALVVPAPLVERLSALVAPKEITQETPLETTLIAAFQLLCHRYSGQDDLLTAFVGSTANPLVLRSQIDDSLPFRAYLQQLRARISTAREHELPFEALVKELSPRRDPSHAPLCQVTIVRAQGDGTPLDGRDLAALENETASSDLTLFIENGACRLLYATDLFARATIQRMCGHLGALLESIARDPDQRVVTLPMLTEKERAQLLYEWNTTHAALPATVAHRLFEARAKAHPDRLAVEFEGSRLTYEQLNERANQIAHHLRRRNVGPETLVGVCLDRCPELVIALLGVWKAGAAYVPLDPGHPPERLSFMLKDAAARVLITDEKHRAAFASDGIPTVCVDSHGMRIAEESTDDPDDVQTTPDQLAYVMYTSGSTGQPKGVMVLHRGLVNYLLWAVATYRPDSGEAVPVHSSIAFDLTVTALFVPLVGGGRVELLSEDVGGQKLVACLRGGRDRSLVKLTPAHLQLICDQLGPERVPHRTNLFVIGGENLTAESLTLWRDFAPATRLINEYGPTETVVGCCVHEVGKDDPRTGSVVIGRPIANTRIYVLDRHLNPLPVGAVGELYIGGAGVARGYLNRAELTKERFLPDPFAREAGARMYKTGDLARYRSDGVLEYLGRVDNQVKIRGYRIELGEIEATLAEHPTVRSCAVLAREDTPGNKQLVGYLVPRDRRPTVEELRSHLREKLPEYMVPGQLVFLDEMPLTHNGKVDRKALPAPSVEAPSGEPPRTEAEKTIAAIFAQLLDRDQVGLHDDFFDLGGHSLLAIKAVAQIRERLGGDLAIETLFDQPTVAALAKLVPQRAEKAEAATTIPALTPAPAYEASFAQRQMWLIEQLVPGTAAYNIVDAIDLPGEPGEVEPTALSRALGELVARHEILRAWFAVGPDGRLMQHVAPPFVPELTDAAGRLQPFDLARAPLFRVSLAGRRLLFTIHHTIADEWSMEVIHEELLALYQAFRSGRPSPLSPLPIQYSAFAAWERERVNRNGPGLSEHWKKELAGAPSVLGLPTDKPRPPRLSLAGAIERFDLPRDLLDRLETLARKENLTLFMVLEAAFAALLHRYTGQADLLVGTPVTRRSHLETHGLIGCFLNTVPLRATFADGATFRALLAQTRERTRRAFAHADLPFEHVVAAVAPARDVGRLPLCQVLFILHDPGGVSKLARVADSAELATGTSKFDLTLYLGQTDAGLEGMLEYRSDLFEPESMRRLGRAFGKLLSEMVRDPDAAIAQLPLLADADRRQVLVEWNTTTVERSRECLHELFAAQAKKTPSRPAVQSGEQTLTYSELERRSDRLARRLAACGVGPDVVVGLYVERSLDMVVGLLGILKAGGAYLPLDPSFPPERLAYMVEHSRTRVLVTHRDLAHVSAKTVVRIDDEAGADETTPAPAAPENLAYVLYTSGSTGRPKGVAVPHRAIVNFLHSMRREPGISENDTLLAVTTLSFDIAALEIFLPLVTGAKVVIASRDDLLDPHRLRDRLQSGAFTILQATPVTWRALIGAGWNGSPALKALCGGEAMAPDLALALLGRCRELWNLYGPTETTVWSTAYRMSAADVPPPIGRPIANTECYVLDPQLGLVPPPAVGELYIGGLGLAREYLHAPELTEERFVKNPYAPGQRMYRTGDVARWRNDGILECFGRTDHQVKLRGFRIELGEIEARLTEHAAVREACVVLRDERLVAYYSTRAPTATNDLRAVLRASLPEYMVPTVFVELAELPRTPNNKIDRKALPAPVLEVAVEPTVAAPRNQIEQALGRVWAKLLGRQQIGVHDDFFDLGGDSLLAVKSVALIREALSVEVSPIEIMRNATIAELARAIAALSAPARAQRTPFYFGRRRLFGFYHPAAAGADAAVLVCSSVGHEHTRAYRTVRELCEVSALAGLPALRFEYSGVGDSAGELATADVDAWTMDILDAADELRRRSGARCLHVVGLRLGAALAVRALKQAQGDFGVLCLWDPLLSGREFLTLASAFQRQYLRDPSRFPPAIMQRHAQRPPADLVLGYGYGDALQRSLASLDVGRTDEWPALSVRAMLSQAAPGWRELAAQLTAQGWHISEEELGSGRTQWNDYDEHERSLRAGPLIARIVERLKEGP